MEDTAAVVREMDAHRTAARGASEKPEGPNELARRIGSVAEFVRRRLAGDYSVDEFGFDPHFTDAVVMPVLRTLFRSWFRVDVGGVENLPETGAALVVEPGSPVTVPGVPVVPGIVGAVGSRAGAGAALPGG